MEIVIMILIGLVAVGVISITSMMKVNSNYLKISEEMYRNQLKYTLYVEKVEKHKKMLEEANQNPEYIQKNNY